MHKGITPVIAVILLLLIAIAVTGISFLFIQRAAEAAGAAGEAQLEHQLGQSGEFFRIEGTSGNDTVYIRNLGDQELSGLVVYVNNNPVTVESGPSIAPGAIGTYILDDTEVAPFNGTVSLKVASSGYTDTVSTVFVPPVPAVCGNDIREGGEVCDTSSPVDCNIINPIIYYSGFFASCNSVLPIPDCSGYNESTCAYCGDGIRQATWEQCDISDFGGDICENYGCTGGAVLLCTGSCTINLSACVCPVPSMRISRVDRNFIEIENTGTAVITGSNVAFTYNGTALTVTNAPSTINPGESRNFTVNDAQLALLSQIHNLTATDSVLSISHTLVNADFYAAYSIGYWKLDGVTTEESGNGNNLILNGVGFSSGNNGRWGEGLDFRAASGNTTYAATDRMVSHKNFTVQLWFKADPTQAETDPTLISLRSKYQFLGNPSGPFYLEFNANTGPPDSDVTPIYYNSSSCTWTGGEHGFSKGDISLGTWHHVVVTYNTSSLISSLYIDGVLAYSAVPIYFNPPYNPMAETACNTVSDIFLGLNYHSNPQYRDPFIGIIDEVRVLNITRPMA